MSLPTIYPADYEVPTTPDSSDDIIARCCGNPLCNCTCFCMANQLHVQEIHSEHHCKICGGCVCDHGAAKNAVFLWSSSKKLPSWLLPEITPFFTGGCTEITASPQIPDWVVEFRK